MFLFWILDSDFWILLLLMRIAILGTRGVPASYGGFETFAEHLSTRLVRRGHDVTVYCRAHYVSPRQIEYHGVRLKVLPTIRHKYFDTVVHTFLSTLYAAPARYDAALICNAANALFAPILRLAGTPVAVNVDGLEHKRKKWNWLGRNYYRLAERLATFFPNEIVTDAHVIQEYYMARYNAPSTMIAYGAEVPPNDGAASQAVGLPSKQFILYVSRLEPENNPELLLDAYRRVQTDWPLVIVGGNAYEAAYVAHLKSLADGRVIFLGPVYGNGYWQLLQEAGLYVFACEVGGVHPALIEAMAAQKPVLYLDTPENRETAGNAGMPFRADSADLAAGISRLLRDANLRQELSRKAHERAARVFGWEETIQKYESVFSELLAKNGRPSSRR